MVIAKALLIEVQKAFVTLNLMAPLAFYAIAKVYLENVDSRFLALARAMLSVV